MLTNLAQSHEIDLIVLAECAIPVATMLRALNQIGDYHYISGLGGCERIDIYSSFSSGFFTTELEEDMVTIRRLKLPKRRGIILAAAHLSSKLYRSEDSQIFEGAELARAIIKVEDKIGHSRTVLVGDLNMNPFEAGVTAAGGLHATMSRQIAQRGTRIVRGKSHTFFYNPMWSLLGDESQGAAWNLLLQFS